MTKNKLEKKINGFTLIEILIVITIIGLIAAIALTSYINIRQKNLNTRIVKDVEQIQTTLRLYYYDNNKYPSEEIFNSGSIYSTSTSGTTTYMEIIPTSQQIAGEVCSSTEKYNYIASSSSYLIEYCLEKSIGNISFGKNCATPRSINEICPE